MLIEGIPEGYELARIGAPRTGEPYLTPRGEIDIAEGNFEGCGYAILRKIEKPKRYRPFANAAEFEPFRDRWWKKTCGDDRVYPPCYYNDSYSGGLHFDRCFIDRIFDDGAPFGIEVTE